MNISRLILRYTLAFLLLVHGIPKVLHIHSFIVESGQFVPYPFNWIIGPAVILIEFGGGLALIAGRMVRSVSLAAGILFTGIMLFVQHTHFFEIFNMNPRDGQAAFEYPFLIAMTAFALYFHRRVNSSEKH